MKSMTASQVKGNLGAVLAGLDAPVQIERHGKPVAVLLPPGGEFLSADRSERLLAREKQATIEAERRARHLAIAVGLLSVPAAEARRRVAEARAVVKRWALEGMCSRDYIERWDALLQLPLQQLAQQMGSDIDGWGTALRQNSPWRVDT